MLAKWLDNAKFYISNYRPVPVEEHLVFENAVYPASSSNRFYRTASQLNLQNGGSSIDPLPDPHRRIQASQHKELRNPLLNSVVALANETARSGFGVLVFCSSKLGRSFLLPYAILKFGFKIGPSLGSNHSISAVQYSGSEFQTSFNSINFLENRSTGLRKRCNCDKPSSPFARCG